VKNRLVVSRHVGGSSRFIQDVARKLKNTGVCVVKPIVAKLADAIDSGSIGVTPVLVQLQSIGIKPNGIQTARLQVPAVLVCHPFGFILADM
jgi:hypothetical protein